MNDFTTELAAAVDSATDTTPAPPGFTDIELAVHALATQFNGQLTYSRATGWHSYPSGSSHWVADQDGDMVTSAVQAMLRDLLPMAPNDKERDKLGSTAKRNNIVSAMQSLPEVRYSGEWDQQAHLLAAPNGVIDLRTGELLPGEPGQRITKSVAVDYDPEAQAPRWEAFLREVFAHDPELPAYMQRLTGYGATGSTREQCFAVLFGEGSNGKSVFLRVLRRLMGEHVATVPFDMFTVSNRARGGPDAEQLVGTRLALASETNRSAVLDSAAIKNATGGEEINVNPKYRKPYAFTPQALILLASNYKPQVKEQDNGTWRRIKVIPFLQRFEGAAQDPDLFEKLEAELPGILAWLVRGAVQWHADGLQDPQSIRDAVAAYRDESDTLAGFLPGRLVLSAGHWTSNADIWTAYKNWAEAEGVDAFRQASTLNRALVERSRGAVTATKQGGQRGLKGIVLAEVLRDAELMTGNDNVLPIKTNSGDAAGQVGQVGQVPVQG